MGWRWSWRQAVPFSVLDELGPRQKSFFFFKEGRRSAVAAASNPQCMAGLPPRVDTFQPTPSWHKRRFESKLVFALLYNAHWNSIVFLYFASVIENIWSKVSKHGDWRKNTDIIMRTRNGIPNNCGKFQHCYIFISARLCPLGSLMEWINLLCQTTFVNCHKHWMSAAATVIFTMWGDRLSRTQKISHFEYHCL